jgi:hypothetical protein
MTVACLQPASTSPLRVNLPWLLVEEPSRPAFPHLSSVFFRELACSTYYVWGGERKQARQETLLEVHRNTQMIQVSWRACIVIFRQ